MTRRTYSEDYIRERNPSLGPHARPGRDPLNIDRFVAIIQGKDGLTRVHKIENGHVVETYPRVVWPNIDPGARIPYNLQNEAIMWANKAGLEVDLTRIQIDV